MLFLTAFTAAFTQLPPTGPGAAVAGAVKPVQARGLTILG